MVRFGFLLFGPAGTVFWKIVGSILAREIVACVVRFGDFLSFWPGGWPFLENFGVDLTNLLNETPRGFWVFHAF